MWRPPDPLDAVVVWRDQAEHAAESLAKSSRNVVVSRLQQRSWTAEDGSARSTVEVVADELGQACGGDGDHDQGDEELVPQPATFAPMASPVSRSQHGGGAHEPHAR
jgi:single-stranded DNA-binding protein